MTKPVKCGTIRYTEIKKFFMPYLIEMIEPFTVGGYFLTFEMNTGIGLGGPAADNKKKFYSYNAAKLGVKIAEKVYPTKKFAVKEKS